MNFCYTLGIYCNWERKRKNWLPDLVSCLKEGECNTKLQKLIYRKKGINGTEDIVENNVDLFAILVTFSQEKWFICEAVPKELNIMAGIVMENKICLFNYFHK